MKKILALILAVVTVAFVLAACADTKGGTEVTTQNQIDSKSSDSVTETEASTVDANGYMLDNLPDNLNFGTTVTIMYWSDVEKPEFKVDDLTGEIVNDAIYNRNLETENRLGIKLNWVGTPGNYQNQATFITQAQNSINAGGDYDIFAGYSMTGATLAVKGFAQNLMNLNYLDFDMPWWPESLIGKATINGKLYFASGDISTNMLHMMYAVFFNKQMIIDYNLESPYELVDSGRWTYGKMFEMGTGIYSDLNGDNKADTSDRYGFCTANIHFDALFTGADLNTVEKDANDRLVMSPTFNSERTVKLLEDICNYMWVSGDAYYGSTGQVFSLGNTLFTLDRSYMALNNKDQLTFEYGIVPVPKFDEAQEKYVTCLGFPYTMYAISSASRNTEAAAATLECLSSEGFRMTTPMLFETTMKYKYTSDNDSARMYDIIRSSVSIDIGRIFTTELQNLSYSIFRDSCVNNAASSWATKFKSSSKIFEKALEKINTSLTNLSN
jgi:ABC-type glycerol-3-phosphate transport system substrate-binding protein